MQKYIRPWLGRASWLALLIGAFHPISASAEVTRGADGIYQCSVNVPGEHGRSMTLFLKLPPGARSAKEIAGVFAFCTWNTDPGTVRAAVLQEGGAGSARRDAQMALGNKYAVLSWTVLPGFGYDAHRNFDNIDAREQRTMELAFDKAARAWRRGADELIKECHLPADGWLLYGISRGGQWAHRLALSQPDLFAAVHVHISTTYGEPVKDANKILWLVTTGELEAGYPSSRRFYAAARGLGYPMLFHGEPKLGHDNHGNIDRLSQAFFAYVMDRRRDPARVTQRQRFVGNYSTHEFLPVALEAHVPAELRVYLPDRQIAEAWGMEAETPATISTGAK